MPHAQLTTADRDHRGCAPGDDRDIDAGTAKLLDPKTVAHVEDLQCLATGAEMQPTVRHHAVNIEDEKANRSGSLAGRARGRHVASTHMTPARNRSSTLRAPTSRPRSSATGSAVM